MKNDLKIKSIVDPFDGKFFMSIGSPSLYYEGEITDSQIVEEIKESDQLNSSIFEGYNKDGKLIRVLHMKNTPFMIAYLTEE